MTYPSLSQTLIILPLSIEMLKKADLNLTRKGKQLAEHPPYSHHNKENQCTRSLLDPLDDSHAPSEPTRLNHAGSTLISPTFQSIPQLSLKDQLYRQDPSLSYINLNFSLKEAAKDAVQGRVGEVQGQGRGGEDIGQLKQQLIEHYKSKKYWSKISALFENDNVDAVLAWQESIDQYRKVKADRQHLQSEKEHLQSQKEQLQGEKQQLQGERQQLVQRVDALQRQLVQDRTQTKVLSVKKCKGCESLQQKERDYQQLYGQSRRSAKQLEEARQAVTEAQDQMRRLEEKHSHLGLLKEELEKKNAKLLQRQRELSGQLQRTEQLLQGTERTLQQDCLASKQLHLSVEKLKEQKYQMEKALTKNEEKQRREVADLRLEMTSLEQERDILAAQSDKAKTELAEARSRLFKVQFEVQAMEESLKLKTMEGQEQKRRHIETMAQEMRRRNDLQDQLTNKQQEIKKAYQLLDEAENARLGLDVQLTRLRKNSQNDDHLQLIHQQQQRLQEQQEHIREQEQRIRDAQDRLREAQQRMRESQERLRSEESQQRIREVDHRKNGMPFSLQNHQSSSPHGSLLTRICLKIKEMHSGLLAGQDNLDSYQKRRGREEREEEGLRTEVSLLRTERQVNEMSTQLANLRNRYQFVWKENETLKTQLQQEVEQLQAELDHNHREIDLKEEALKTLVSCIPEALKEDVLELLCLTERLAAADDHQDHTDLDEHQEQKARVEERAKEWKEQWGKTERRLRRLEEEMRRLEEENEQLRRKGKAEPKRLVTEYDYKKDVRKKYNI